MLVASKNNKLQYGSEKVINTSGYVQELKQNVISERGLTVRLPKIVLSCNCDTN